MNTKKFIGIAGTIVVLGGAAYCVKKYLDSKKEYVENPDSVIDLKQAREIMEMERRVKESTEETARKFGMTSEEIDELRDEAREVVDYNIGFQTDSSTPIHEYDFYDDVDYNLPLAKTITEEDKVLRFDPNSVQARDQFIKMELAEFLPGDREYQIMKKAFDFQFEPQNKGDGILFSQLADYRLEFFGEDSRWVENVTVADIICHYARLTDYNVGGGIAKWITHFIHHLEFNELNHESVWLEAIERLMDHRFINARTNTYSIFGLDVDQIEEAREWAEGTVDGMMTFEIEFNVFLSAVNV